MGHNGKVGQGGFKQAIAGKRDQDTVDKHGGALGGASTAAMFQCLRTTRSSQLRNGQLIVSGEQACRARGNRPKRRRIGVANAGRTDDLLISGAAERCDLGNVVQIVGREALRTFSHFDAQCRRRRNE